MERCNENIWNTNRYKNWYNNTVADVREIIFTQEFMDKYVKHAHKIKNEYQYYNFLEYILLNLSDPVEYLYKLIKEND